jgi:protein-L-isoaspartate(D-aspartate) O-methyltransferase
MERPPSSRRRRIAPTGAGRHSARIVLAWVIAFASAPGSCVAQQDRGARDANRKATAAEAGKAVADSSELADERARMVREQIEERGIEDRRVLDAFRAVPRHLFVPEPLRDMAYADQPLPIGEGQTISQPYIVAYMTDALKLEPGDRVLEVGTGSGYQAAIASELADSVFTIEIVRGLAASAAERLRHLAYHNVVVRQGDGYLGWPEHAPFDAIVVTAGADHVPPPLVEQLAPGGRMVIPVGGADELQHLLVIEKDAEGRVTQRTSLPVRFVPLVREREPGR